MIRSALELPLHRCPHCGRANPTLIRVWNNDDKPTPRADGGEPRHWAVFGCRSCGSLVVARGYDAGRVSYGGKQVLSLEVDLHYPPLQSVDDAIPSDAKRFLQQALETMHAPDASVLMCASAIDAMLKDNGLSEGSLHKRLNEALERQLIPKALTEWAHRVRLDANGTRHADEGLMPLGQEDAERSVEFAKAMAVIRHGILTLVWGLSASNIDPLC